MLTKNSATEAIENNSRIEYREKVHITVEFPYAELGNIERQLNSSEWDIIRKDFRDNCLFRLSCFKEDAVNLTEELKSINGLEIKT